MEARLFLFTAAGGSAAIGGAVALARVAAGLLSGGGLDGAMEPLRNAGIDAVAVAATAALAQSDLHAQALRVRRVETGRQLAALRVRLQWPRDSSIVSLAELRSGRGRDSRVVIVAGERAAVDFAVESSVSFSERLRAQQQLLVQLVLDEEAPGGAAPAAGAVGNGARRAPGRPRRLGRVRARHGGRAAGRPERADARRGRAVQARQPLPWDTLLTDVERRRDAGLDNE